MSKDQEMVKEADLALVAASYRYYDADAVGKVEIQPHLDSARAAWATARYRLLFPGEISTQGDLEAVRALKAQIEVAADRQKLIAGLISLGGLMVKFVH